MSDSLRPHEPQHTRPPYPSPTPRVHPNLCPSSRCCHPTISSSVVPFFSCSQSLPAPGSFPMSQLFTSGGQSIGVSASTSVLPMNTQDWSPLGWKKVIQMNTCLILRWKAFLNMTKSNHKKNDKVDHKKFTILSRKKKIHKIKTQTALWKKICNIWCVINNGSFQNNRKKDEYAIGKKRGQDHDQAIWNEEDANNP